MRDANIGSQAVFGERGHLSAGGGVVGLAVYSQKGKGRIPKEKDWGAE